MHGGTQFRLPAPRGTHLQPSSPLPVSFIRRPPTRQPSSQRGFTLIELMTVVALVGVVSMLAVPGGVKQMQDHNARRFAGAFAQRIQGAKMRAMGRGAAVRVLINTGTGQLTISETVAQGEPSGTCLIPTNSCLRGNWDTGMRTVGSYGMDDNLTMSVSGFASPLDALTQKSVEICFTPTGRTFQRYAALAGDPMEPLKQSPIFHIKHVAGQQVRRVIVLPTGTTRFHF